MSAQLALALPPAAPSNCVVINARCSLRMLETLLLKGAQAAGFDTDLWTCPRVTELIARQLGVNYHVDHVGRLLHD